MPKVKTTKARTQNLLNSVTMLLNQERVEPLFAVLLAAIKFKVEKIVEGLTMGLEKLDDQVILRDSDGQKVPMLGPDNKPVPNRWKVDPVKAETFAEEKKELLDASCGFRAPMVRLSTLQDNWVEQEEDKKAGISVPGWVISSFFDVGLLEIDVKDDSLAFLADLMAEDDDEEEAREGPMIPGKPEKKAAKKTSRTASK